MQLFERVSEIVKSNQPDAHKKIEFLRVHEARNQNRPEILRLLESAVNEIPGALGLRGNDEVLNEVEKQYDERMAQGHFNPLANAQTGKVDVSKVM